MAILTRVEFASMVGRTTGYINTYIGRKKIVLIETGDDKGKIDTENPLNIYFIKNLKKKNNAKKRTRKVEVKEIKMPTKRKTLTKEEREAQEAERKRNEEYLKLTHRKEIADTIKAEKDAELKTLQLEKMMGKLMPVELVQSILKINIQSIFINFENELQNIASVYTDILAGGDRKKLAEIISAMRDNLERIIVKTKRNSSKEIQSAIDDYAVSRNRGERK